MVMKEVQKLEESINNKDIIKGVIKIADQCTRHYVIQGKKCQQNKFWEEKGSSMQFRILMWDAERNVNGDIDWRGKAKAPIIVSFWNQFSQNTNEEFLAT